MVTGAYYPEKSGAGLQCRALIQACGDRGRFTVLTTAVDASLPARDTIDGVPVRRVLVSATSRLARVFALPSLLAAALRSIRAVDIVHLHGFSAKSIVLVRLARLFGKRIVIKLTSVGHDDAVSMAAHDPAAFRQYRRADRFVAVSPRFAALHAEAGLPPERLTVIPNGVDVDRFRPAAPEEKPRLRRTLGLPADRLVVLFVGFFSHEKRPDVAFRAWADASAGAPASTLVFIGRTASPYYEIDEALAQTIRRDATRLGVGDRVIFVEDTDAIERYYRAADVLMFPSTREGLPNVVLEAMASSLACVVSTLPGVTDVLIASDVNGVLVAPDDLPGYATALRRLIVDAALRARMGAEARRTIEVGFSIARTAAAHVAMYRDLMKGSPAA
jgi:glycosyltransferase involved in cell wall biosynthesis